MIFSAAKDGAMGLLFRRCLMSRPSKVLLGLLVCILGLSFRIAARAQTSVTTYHGDAKRTGWNPSESVLTPSSVTPTTFKLLASVLLDDQVDAQPLVTGQTIAGQVINVVYVATENNTVYAIDGSTGNLLKTAHLGPPVPSPLGCQNNGPNVGITGTPTIDVGRQTIYVITYELRNSLPSYRLHALSLQTLQDVTGSPIPISASHLLADGSKYTFNPKVQRERAALLESSGEIYAAFGSFCDFSASSSRGWLLGWSAGNLAPLGANELTDTLTTAPASNGTNYFLSSIWMSGYGLAADASGNVFFVTGNSDPAVDTYTGTTNIQESAVKMPSNLIGVLDLFTPSNAFTLDQRDTDYAAGGLLVVPPQPGPVPKLAVAAGKDGRLFILNRDDMGGFHNPDIPAQVGIGHCWCGPSYYQGSDGVGRVVTSGGTNVKTWTINTSLRPALTLEASSTSLATTAQDAGFFTTVSSNGTKSNTAIIWAIGRPTSSDHHITLYAFNGTKSGSTLPLLWSGSAGFWPNVSGNANLVPTVANGKVYVASNRQLAIFGTTAAAVQMQAQLQQPPAVSSSSPAGAQFWGTVENINDSSLVIILRTGRLLQIDLSAAIAEGTTIVPVIGESVAVSGELDEHGVLQARVMWRAKGPESWGADKAG
jgi:hypothetical protein